MRGTTVLVLVFAAGCAISNLGGDDTEPGQAEPAVVSEVVAEPDPEPAPAPETSISMGGGGDLSSDPFVLDPGDYVVTWTASDCSTGFSLKPLDGQWPYVRLATSGRGATEGRDNVFDVEGGRWYLEVHTGPAPGCPWTLELEPR